MSFMAEVYHINWVQTEQPNDAMWIYSAKSYGDTYTTPRLSPVISEYYKKETPPTITGKDESTQLHVDYDPSEGFDMISAIYFMLSRYEEYIYTDRDQHNRYTGKQSVASKYGFLELPIIDIWLDQWAKEWNNRYPEHLLRSKNTYQWQPTVDVDLAFAYAHKGWKTYAGFIKDILTGKLYNLLPRLKSIISDKYDPYNSFKYLNKINRSDQTSATYFILLGDYGQFDQSFGKDHNAFINIIKAIADNNQIGIHPSYASNENVLLIKEEKKNLEKIIDKPIKHSRQHYLKLDLPTTYQNLIQAHITHDHTMGYADLIGYRAGTGHSFYWYDMENEKTTNLRVHPFQIMDVTLLKYMQCTADEAIEKIAQIKKIAQKYNSPLTTLWHNSSFNIKEWKGWKRVYESISLYKKSDK